MAIYLCILCNVYTVYLMVQADSATIDEKLGYICERNITILSVYLLHDYTNYLLSTITVVDGAAVSAEPWTRPPGE